ncbi:acyltransferase family protein [Duganella callida]|uniref:acyltransferase family protein n=1 Tax=Duganella callida TaxID=2561932 RepID=UPI001431ABBA|nr:acyltransferase [Duganella callida]
MNRPPLRTLAEAADARDNGFNLVRLGAALAVYYFHAYMTTGIVPGGDPVGRWIDPVADIGKLALAVFFLISGFFVSQSWMHDPHVLRFTLRRAARLLPALAVAVPLTAATAVLCYGSPQAAGFWSHDTWRYIIGNVTLHGLRFVVPQGEWHIPGVLQGGAINGPLWTLYWEGRMYVMVALIGVAAALPLRQWLGGMAVLLLLSAQLFPEVAAGYIWELRLWSMFLLGMLCCALAPQLRVGGIQVACVGVFVWLNWARNVTMSPSGFTWFGLAALCCMATLWIGSRRVTGWRHLRRHDYSYGIYLYHWPVMSMLKLSFPALTAIPMLFAALAPTLALAAFSWHFIEAPALRAVRRRLAAGS